MDSESATVVGARAEGESVLGFVASSMTCSPVDDPSCQHSPGTHRQSPSVASDDGVDVDYMPFISVGRQQSVRGSHSAKMLNGRKAGKEATDQ